MAVVISLYLGLKPKTKAKITVSAVINKVDYYIENNPGGTKIKLSLVLENREEQEAIIDSINLSRTVNEKSKFFDVELSDDSEKHIIGGTTNVISEYLADQTSDLGRQFDTFELWNDENFENSVKDNGFIISISFWNAPTVKIKSEDVDVRNKDTRFIQI